MRKILFAAIVMLTLMCLSMRAGATVEADPYIIDDYGTIMAPAHVSPEQRTAICGVTALPTTCFMASSLNEHIERRKSVAEYYRIMLILKLEYKVDDFSFGDMSIRGSEFLLECSYRNQWAVSFRNNETGRESELTWRQKDDLIKLCEVKSAAILADKRIFP